MKRWLTGVLRDATRTTTDSEVDEPRLRSFVDEHVIGLTTVVLGTAAFCLMIGVAIVLGLLYLERFYRDIFVFILLVLIAFPLRTLFDVIVMETVRCVFRSAKQ